MSAGWEGREKPGRQRADRVFRLVENNGFLFALERAVRKLGGFLNHGLPLFGHLADLFLVKGIGVGHQQSDRSSIHEGSSDFVQLFEIGTQSLVGGRSCAAGDGDEVGLCWLGDLSLIHFFQLETGLVKGLPHVSLHQLCLFAVESDEGGHSREHDLVNSLYLAQGRTGLVCSASPTTAEGYGVSCDCRCGDLFSFGRGSKSHRRYRSKGTHDAES